MPNIVIAEKMRRIVTGLLTMTLIISCGHYSNDYYRLEKIDSLLAQEQTDSALYLIEDINPNNLDNESAAYYHLLLTQSNYKAYRPIKSDSIINLAIDFYKNNGNDDILARCHFYKAGILCELGKNVDALDNLKKAEKLVMSSSNYTLRHNIYYMISSINSDYQEYEIALNYVKRALEYSLQTKKKDLLAYDYEILFLLYNKIGKKDSCLYFLNKTIRLIESIPANPPINRARLWGNLGVAFSSIDQNKAEQFLEKANSLVPQDNVYGQLAEISLKKGDTLKAMRLLKEGFSVSNNVMFKEKIAKLMGKIEQESGNYKQANEWMSREQALKDSLTRKHREDNIKAQQIAFEDAAKQEHSNDLLTYALIAIGCIAFGSTGIVWYLRRRAAKVRLKAAEELKSANQELETTQEKLVTAHQDLRSTARQLKSTSKKLEKLKEEQKEEHKEQQALAKTLESGHKLYTELLSGGNTAQWDRKMFADFIDYFRQVNPEYAQQTDTNYQHLTPNENIFLAFTYLGKTEEEVRDAMNLSDGAFNTMKSRLRQKTSHRLP